MAEITQQEYDQRTQICHGCMFKQGLFCSITQQKIAIQTWSSEDSCPKLFWN